MANTAETPFRRWARANFTTSFLYPIMVSRASSCLFSSIQPFHDWKRVWRREIGGKHQKLTYIFSIGDMVLPEA